MTDILPTINALIRSARFDSCTFELAENCGRKSRLHRQDRQPVLH
jgi:hypothetical protein